MTDRFWDPDNKYGDALIKEYRYWVLEVHYKQVTLGSFIIFAKRKLENFSDLTKGELVELTEVMREIQSALTELFQPESFNYLQLGNQMHNLHFHGIPRYSEARIAFGKKWKDETFGHPPKWPEKEISRELVMIIRDQIKKHID